MFNILHSHYKIIQVLGLGKSGITYLAEDLDLINSPLYVIKEIQYVNNDGSIPRSIEELFELQGSIAYRVGQHPQMPSLVAKFEENGNRYLVREYIEGELIAAEFKLGSTWSQTQVFDFLMDLVGTLAFVHSFKYIHQDINPHNIIRRNDDGRFNLIGFSAIKDLGHTWQNVSSNYLPDPIDHSYVPYEQSQNAPQFNTDLYAVGAIAIQSLTGKFPLDRDPDSYEFNWRNDLKIDNKLIKIIDRMVRPDYRNRYQSALEVLQDLQSFALDQLPTNKPHRFNPYLIFGSAISVLLIGFGLSKLLSASANKLQVSPPPLTAAQTPSTKISNQIGWQKYLDQISGIKINYPNSWQQEEVRNILTGETTLFSSPQQNSVDKYRENISIRVENLTNPHTTLSNYTKSAIAEIQQYDRAAKIIESSSTTLSHRAANLIVYTGKDENSLPIKNLEVWTIDRGKVYILTYKAEPGKYYQYLETAMTMINSFELE
jgi:eukaryotic-like serine/threonine-protein kinase